jgi:6-phosphogluconolactonase (cycloisomerase 2 family)
VYPVSSAGVVGAGTVYQAGTGPQSVAVKTGFAYVGNNSDNTISGYTVASGPALTALSAVSAPAAVRSLAFDKSGTYLLANGYGTSNGLQLYTLGTTGTLTSASSAGTGTTTSIPAVMALTH